MDPTTLLTFLFRAPPHVRAVELLGSWDNFAQPYRMHHDRRRGTAFYSGCFKFDRIIFDGDHFRCTKPRSGGLKQGGTYWYYYRLDYDVDAHDHTHPHTTSCPLLPGQPVNVIEVPYEIIEPPTRCRSAYGMTDDIAGSLATYAREKTLDPAQKTAALEPPPISKVHARCLSDEALDGRLEHENAPAVLVDGSVSHLSTSPKQVPEIARDSNMSPRLAGDDDDDDDDDASPPTSASSLYSSHTSPGSVVSGTFDLGASEYSDDYEEGGLPSFPYPCTLGSTPLGSEDKLRARTATGDDVIPHSARVLARHRVDDHASKRMQRVSELSLGPKSVQNVQFYGSRPGTCLTEDPEQYRPRIYSLPNMELRDYLDESSPISPTSCYSHRASEDVDEAPTPDSDGAFFEFVSPTFTELTVDTEGHNTPFRLSADTSYSMGSHATTNEPARPGVVAALSWSQDSNQDRAQYVTASVAANDRSHTRLLPPTFVNYSLPSLASESSQSLTKSIVTTTPQQQTPRSRDNIQIPSPTIYNEGVGRSMAEDIFSELGF